MILTIHVKPGSRMEKIEKISESEWTMKVRAIPAEGKANEAVLLAIAGELGIAKSRIRIVRGFSSRTKSIEVMDF